MGKIKDLKVVTGTYTDRNGQEKRSWKTVGAIMEGKNGQYVLLDRTFNPAGVPVEDGRSSITLMPFDPPSDTGQKQANEPPKKASASVGLNDEIPW